MKKIWDKKSMLNFSRQAYNEKVTDCHALFRILRFFELGCFLGRNIDLGGSFPTHDLKFGQFWGLQNFVVFQKFLVFISSNSKELLFSRIVFYVSPVDQDICQGRDYAKAFPRGVQSPYRPEANLEVRDANLRHTSGLKPWH